MLTKDQYRSLLNDIKSYIKLSYFADEIGLSRTTLSLFLKDSAYNYMISVNRLDELYNCIIKKCNSI